MGAMLKLFESEVSRHEPISPERAAYEREPVEYVHEHDTDDGCNFTRGLVWCVLLSVVAWSVIVAAAWWVAERWM